MINIVRGPKESKIEGLHCCMAKGGPASHVKTMSYSLKSSGVADVSSCTFAVS